MAEDQETTGKLIHSAEDSSEFDPQEFQKEAYEDVQRVDAIIRRLSEDQGLPQDFLRDWVREKGVFDYSDFDPEIDDEAPFVEAENKVKESLGTLDGDDREFMTSIRGSSYNALNGEAKKYEETLRSEYIQRKTSEGLSQEEAERAWGSAIVAENIDRRNSSLVEEESGYTVRYAFGGSEALWLLKGADKVQEATSDDGELFQLEDEDKSKAARQALSGWNRQIGDVDCSTWGANRANSKHFRPRSDLSESEAIVVKPVDSEAPFNIEFRSSGTDIVVNRLLIVSVAGREYPVNHPTEMLAYKLIQATQRQEKDYKEDFAAIDALSNVVDDPERDDRVREILDKALPKETDEDDIQFVKDNIESNVPDHYKKYFI